MRSVIAIIKIVSLFLFTILFFVTYSVLLLLNRLFNRPFEPLRNSAMHFWSAGSALILNMKMKAVGTPPKAPFIMVANHLSYLDIIPIYLNTNCTFVAKKAVRSWPLIGMMVAAMGVIFVDRSRKRDVIRVNRLLTENLNENQGIVLFPEGTSSGGEQVLPFRSPLLEFPASENIPVHFASISYETSPKDEPAEQSVCFFGKRHSFPEHVFKMAKNRRIECTIRFGEHAVVKSDRKELADILRLEIEQIFTKTDQQRK
jgi:1-acyl-sn-glycerol-3-phosphate acyltransferase